ncbi:MAG TPA: hypothetical protein VL382_00295 [Terriglobales bacterium]|jgi:hypothetical protein|nr:hypothetical protein [Terriglobales bacterium]
MQRTLLVCGTVLVLALVAPADDKKREQEVTSTQPPIRVCVATLRNVARRSIGVTLQRDALVRDLKQSKPPKKAADQRRIEGIALEGDSPASAGGEIGEKKCEYVVYTTVTDLRDKSDPLWRDEKQQGIGNLPPQGSRHEEVTFAQVEFSILKAGNPNPLVSSSVSGEETNSEDGTVRLMMDRIASRVNTVVREAPDPMRE